MKKIFNILLLPIIFVLYIALFLNTSLNECLKKENIEKFVNELDISELVDVETNKEILDTNGYIIIIRSIINNSINSFLNEKEVISYTQKDIVELIDKNIDNILIEAKLNRLDKEEIKAEIYKSCINLYDEIPNITTMISDEIEQLNSIKSFYSKNAKRNIIIFLIFLVVCTIPLTFDTFEWLKYNGIIMVTSSISYLLMLYLLNTTINNFGISYINSITDEIFSCISTSVMGLGKLFIIFGILQIIVYFVVSQDINKKTNINNL